jgi:hypothetical protein
MSEIKEKPVAINKLHLKTSSAVNLTMSTNWHCKVLFF